MHLVQRERERALLHQLYEDCARGQGRVVHITGPIASGKSALLSDFVDYVTARGGSHLPASGTRSEQSLPLGLINQVMEAAGLHVIEPEGEPALEDPERLPAWLIPRLKELHHELRKIAVHTPLVLHIDDVHLADAASIHCLLYVLRRLRGTPVLAVITKRLPQRASPGPLTALAWLPQSIRIQLLPLNEADVRALLSEHRLQTDDRTVTDLMLFTGGIPALVLAALEDRRAGLGRPREDSGPITGSPPGEVYCAAFSEYLHRHEPAVMELAKNLAVMGEAAHQEGASPLPPPHHLKAQDSLDRLQTAGILDANGSFRHPRTQAAILNLMGPEERAETHLWCARTLHEYDAPVTRVARHLRHAGHVSDPWAVPLLCEASEQALSEGDITSAIDYLSSAAAFCTDPESKPKIVLALAATLWRADPEAASRHLLRLTDDAVDGRLPACELYALLRGLLWTGHRTEAERVLRNLPEPLRRDPDPAATVEMRITRSTCATSHPDVTDLLPVHSAPGDIADIPRITTPILRLNGAEALAMTLIRKSHDEATVMAEEVLANASLGEHMVEAVFAALSALIYSDRLGRATYWSESLIAMSDQRSPLWRAQAHMLRAEVALRLGELGTAHHHATVALSSMSRPSWGTAVGLPLSHLLQTAEATGDRETATRIVNESLSEELFRSRYGLHFLYARGHHHLNAGRAEAALSDFSVCGELMVKWGLDNPALVPWRGGASRAQLRLGDREAARALVSAQAALVDPGLTRTRGIVLLDLAWTLTHKEQVTVLEEAVLLLDRAPDSLHAAQGRLDLACALESVGDEGGASSLREQARLALDESTAPLSGESRALPRVPRPSASPSLPSSEGSRSASTNLSKAELRVASLAAKGLTNRQISSRLHITISTVEQHLTRIYRKCEVSAREQIADILVPGTDVTL